MEHNIEAAIAIGSVVASIGGAWAIVQKLKEEVAQIWGQISKLRDWETLHDKEAGEYRLGIEKQFGVVNVKMADNTGRFEAIMSAISDLKKQLERLQDNQDKI